MTCCACGRRFGGLTGFDKHQAWVYGAWKTYVRCQDPATMTRKDGSPLFKWTGTKWVLRTNREHPNA